MKKNLNQILALFLLLLSLGTMAIAGEIKGKVTAQHQKSAVDIAVYVDTIPGKTFTPPATGPVADQKHMTFVPHVMVVLKGTTVQFLNSDPVGHNVFWPNISGNKKLAHNLGTWPQGQRKSFTFDTPGIIPMFCNVHPDMSGYLVVSPTPYFATTDKSGAYKIGNVPDGTYTVTAWNEGTKSKSNPVNVTGDATADFTLSK